MLSKQKFNSFPYLKTNYNSPLKCKIIVLQIVLERHNLNLKRSYGIQNIQELCLKCIIVCLFV